MRKLTVIACMIAVTATLGAADVWLDEGFEDVRSIEESAWKVDDSAGWARVRSIGGPQRLVAAFNSRGYSTARVYVRIQRGSGTVWFDNVDIDGLHIDNANFSEHDGNRITGWGQDNIGKTIFWDGDHGSGSVRITHKKPLGMSRVFQNVECEPNTDYRLEVWADSEDLQGTAYTEVYGVNPGGGLGAQLGSSSHIRPPDEKTGGHALAIHPRSGPVTISREVKGAGDRLGTLSADVNTEGLGEGAITLAITDADSGDVLAESVLAVDPKAREFVPIRLGFAAPAEARVQASITVAGQGTALIDNIAVGDVDLPIPPRRTRLGRLSDGCAIGGVPAGTDDPVLVNAIALLEERLADMGASGGAPVEVEITDRDADWPDSERYELSADTDGVRITAATPTGAAWGLMTLLDLAEAGGGLVPECEITDRPAMPFRGTYRAGVPSGDALVEFCRRLMRLKMNAVVMESGVWYSLGNEDTRAKTREAFDTFRAWGIEPIPEIQSLGHAGGQLSRNPHCVEGAWQQDEELTLTGTEPVALAHNNVLRTDATDIVITGGDGETTYVEGEDYEVIDGVTDFPYDPEAEPYRVRRIEGGAIADGATVLASYDHAVKMGSRNIPYCPSEPAVYDILLPVIEDTIRYLEPETVHIGHDEPRIVNSDSRCIKRDITGGEILAEDIVKINDFAHSIDPDVTLMMWADALNPYHNGTWFSDENEHQLDLVPKDVVQNIWFYGATQPLTRGRDSFEHFQRYGFTFTGSPWDDTTCCRNWGVVAGEARRRGMNCPGLLYTSWSARWAGLETLASVAWNPPRK
ncbi:MAG: hypothetical protein GF393_11205 [Armatimonadia bacterium]|nr:hypothetical protein [Armatimonadia bacterium]